MIANAKRRRQAVRWSLLAASLAAVCACGRSPTAVGEKTTLVPFKRFVDEAASPRWNALRSYAYEPWRRLGGSWPLRTKGLATATIADDTRYVLAAPPSVVDNFAVGGSLLETGYREVEVALPESFSGSSRAAVRTAVRAGTHWSEPQLLGVFPMKGQRGDGLAVSVPLPAAASEVGSTHLYVEVFGDAEALSAYETRTSLVPRGTRLRFSTGMLPGSAPQTKVVFSIAACAATSCREIFRDERVAVGEKGASWRDLSLSLDAFVGQKISLRFRAEAVANERDSVVFPVWANPVLYAPEVATRPSVILISLDTLRADRLPTYGYGRDTAPFLDASFGTAGTVFEDCTSSAASTGSAHMTIMTSLEPPAHGVRRSIETIVPGVITIAEALRADGVTTGAVTENGWLVYAHGFGRGFESYSENRSEDIQNPRGEIDKTLDAAAAWISVNGGSPFFLFVHTYQVHDPYTPPGPYQKLFVADGAEPSDSDRYDQEIRFADDRLREFFVSLEQSGALDDVIVIVTSDHGEAFLEHGYLKHSSLLHQEIVRVPCLFRGAGIRQGSRVKAPVGLIDLAPTIAGLMHAPVPRQFRGSDLGALLSGDALRLEARLRDRVIVSEEWSAMLSGPEMSFLRLVPPALAFRRGSFKVMRSETPDTIRYEAYDLVADPREGNDLSRSDASSTLRGLRDQLDEYLSAARRNDARALDAAPEQVTSNTTGESGLGPDTQNKLRALGYIE